MPLGVKCSDNFIYARIFKNSRFYPKVEEGLPILLYLASDARLFYRAIIRKLEAIYDKGSHCYKIPGISRHIKGVIEGIKESENFKLVEIRPIEGSKALELLDQGYSRADGCLIELMVYYTKLEAKVVTKKDYCKIYYVCSESIKRSTTDHYYLEILDELRC
jgi:hypothetical protein